MFFLLEFPVFQEGHLNYESTVRQKEKETRYVKNKILCIIYWYKRSRWNISLLVREATWRRGVKKRKYTV